MCPRIAWLLPVTSPPVSSDMDVTDCAPPSALTGAGGPPAGPATEATPATGDTRVTIEPPVSLGKDSQQGQDVNNQPLVTEPVAAVWTLEHVASHYRASTRTIRRWIKDPAKAPVRLYALAGDDGTEAVPLQVTGNLPPLRKSGEDDPGGTVETDTTALMQTPREADLTEIIEGLSRELNQQYREQISRLIAERDAERDARLEAEIRAALAQDRADRVQNALDDAITAVTPLLASPADAPPIGRLAHLWAAIRLG